MTNFSRNLTEELVEDTLPVYIGSLIIIFSAIPFTSNIVIIVVCIKALRKKFHNLCVLSLCFSDSIMSLSYALSALSAMIPSIDKNLVSCLCQIFTLTFSSTATYCLIFLICMERYLTVRSFNFGMNKKIDRYKYHLITGAFAVAFLVSTTGTYMIPFNYDIQSCSTNYLYGEHYRTFVIVIAGPTTLSVFLTVATTIFTGRHIWKIFFLKTKVTPLVEINKESVILKREIFQPSTRSKTSTNTNVNITTKESHLFVCQSGSHREQDTESNSIDTISFIGIDDVKFAFQEHEEQSQKPQGKIRNSIVSSQSAGSGRSWQMRAFATSVIVATVTFLLTGPLIAMLWYDAFTDAGTSPRARFLVFLLYIVNTLIDPIIYAWRIPEIRQQFRRVWGNNQVHVI